MAKKLFIVVLIIGSLIGFFFGFFKLKEFAKANKPGQQIEEMNRIHITRGQPHDPYNSTPPTSGPHYADTKDWGVYDEPVEEELFIHNLEHGGVILLHNNLDEASLAKLKNLARELEKINGRILMAPYPKLTDAKIALTAWGWLDKLESYDEQRIRDFFIEHVDQGPEKVPLGEHVD